MKPDLLLLHGALGSAAQLDPLAGRLASDFAVHRLDFEGHGPLAPPERPYRTERFAENVLAYLDERGLERADIFGYSMGGYVGLWLAATAPERVRALATLGTMLAWSPEVAAAEERKLDPDTIAAKVPRFAELLRARHGDPGWARVLEATAEMMRDLGATPRVDADLLASIRQPVRVMVGDRDEVVSLTESAEAVARLPAGELEVLPGTPHPFERVPAERVAFSLRELFGSALADPPIESR